MGRNTALLIENMQPRRERWYGGRGGQVIGRTRDQNVRNQYRGIEMGPGSMAVDRGGKGYRKYYNYRGFGHMA